MSLHIPVGEKNGPDSGTVGHVGSEPNCAAQDTEWGRTEFAWNENQHRENSGYDH